jgi:hypothetical protein
MVPFGRAFGGIIIMGMKIWQCKIGEASPGEGLFHGGGCDAPMRQAVRDAFIEIVGREPDYIFSGWDASLTNGERAVVDDTELTDEFLISSISDDIIKLESELESSREALRSLIENKND